MSNTRTDAISGNNNQLNKTIREGVGGGNPRNGGTRRNTVIGYSLKQVPNGTPVLASAVVTPRRSTKNNNTRVRGGGNQGTNGAINARQRNNNRKKPNLPNKTKNGFLAKFNDFCEGHPHHKIFAYVLLILLVIDALRTGNLGGGVFSFFVWYLIARTWCRPITFFFIPVFIILFIMMLAVVFVSSAPEGITEIETQGGEGAFSNLIRVQGDEGVISSEIRVK